MLLQQKSAVKVAITGMVAAAASGSLRGMRLPVCSSHTQFLMKLLNFLVYKKRLTFEFYSANRKKAEARKTGGGPPPPPLTAAEELALSQTVTDQWLKAYPTGHEMDG